jgi:hypothetical protein
MIITFAHSHTHTHTDRRNDLYCFSPAANTWTALSPSGSAPAPRSHLGFAATPDGMLYVFGGNGVSGQMRGGWAGYLQCIYVNMLLLAPDSIMRRAYATLFLSVCLSLFLALSLSLSLSVILSLPPSLSLSLSLSLGRGNGQIYGFARGTKPPGFLMI